MMPFNKRISLSVAAVATSVFLLPIQAIADSAPYDYGTKYQSVLNGSKLQAPDSSTVAIAQGDFEGTYNEYFYIPSSGNKWLTFQIGPDEKMRSELRQMENWYTSDTSYNKMIGEVLLLEKGTADEVTLMQIHDDANAAVDEGEDKINKPLVRIAWLEEQKETGASSKTYDSYFAIVKTGTCASSCSDYVKYKLADYSATEAVKFEIKVANNQLTIKVNGVAHEEFNNFDVSYWDGLPSYFKAGAYIQSDTSPDVEVQFSSLKYYD